MALRKFLMTATVMGLLAVSTTADAAEVKLEIQWADGTSYGGTDFVGTQSFIIDTTAGFLGGAPGFLYFTTRNDSLGRDTVFFGDGVDRGAFINSTGTGFINADLTVGAGNFDIFGPIWSGTGTTLSIAPGDRFTGSRGSVISVLAAPAIPEPGTWTMMALGFGLAGSAMRAAGRRRQTVTAAAS